MVEKICPKCGASSKDREFKNNFCIDCYVSLNVPKLPEKVTMYICRECEDIKIKSWNDIDPVLTLETMFKDKILGRPIIEIHDKNISIEYPDKLRGKKFNVKLRRKESLCDECGRKAAGYYEAIVQIRGDIAKDERIIDKIITSLEKSSTFITKIVQLKEGMDIYVGDKKITRAIISSLRLKAKVTNTLYGVKDGRRVYRTTFAIREKKGRN